MVTWNAPSLCIASRGILFLWQFFFAIFATFAALREDFGFSFAAARGKDVLAKTQRGRKGSQDVGCDNRGPTVAPSYY